MRGEKVEAKSRGGGRGGRAGRWGGWFDYLQEEEGGEGFW